MPKPLPPEPAVPLLTRLRWQAWSYLTWPRDIRQLKRQGGWRRTGWMQWESGPQEAQEGSNEDGAGHG
jgi:hypothetical protein